MLVEGKGVIANFQSSSKNGVETTNNSLLKARSMEGISLLRSIA